MLGADAVHVFSKFRTTILRAAVKLSSPKHSVDLQGKFAKKHKNSE